MKTCRGEIFFVCWGKGVGAVRCVCWGKGVGGVRCVCWGKGSVCVCGWVAFGVCVCSVCVLG